MLYIRAAAAGTCLCVCPALFAGETTNCKMQQTLKIAYDPTDKPIGKNMHVFNNANITSIIAKQVETGKHMGDRPIKETPKCTASVQSWQKPKSHLTQCRRNINGHKHHNTELSFAEFIL